MLHLMATLTLLYLLSGGHEPPEEPRLTVRNEKIITVTDHAAEAETYILTAYCPCAACCGKSDGITATGTIAAEGRTIATDPAVLPYGTKVKIKGLGEFVSEDCGSSIAGKRIDVFFNSHQEALEFGVQEREVIIIGKEESGE